MGSWVFDPFQGLLSFMCVWRPQSVGHTTINYLNTTQGKIQGH